MLERVRGEALAERLEVLRGEHRRRHQHGDLHAVGDRLERRPQRDLGLAVANVAHHQAVHRPTALQVGLHLGGRLQLVDRLLVETRPPSPAATASRD